MLLKHFIKDKLLQICMLLFAIITIEIFLSIYSFGTFIKLYIPIIILSIYGLSVSIEYLVKKRYYTNVSNLLNNLEDKYLITEIIKEPDFVEGKILIEYLNEINKSMLENVNKYKYLAEDYKEYIEMWIHEIKIPIATSKMIIENNKNYVTKSIDEELDKIENFTEQALYYARSNTVEKDYYIKKSFLKNIVNEAVRKNKTALIGEKININAHDLEKQVNTDSKWVIFILNQIIQNSIKYRKENIESEIEIYSKEGKENVILHIKDNGIGIKNGEVTRVFDKGFTGTNGRLLNKKSTGIGLYLCKKLCDKLGIGICIEAKEGKGTDVKLIFPNSSYMILD